MIAKLLGYCVFLFYLTIAEKLSIGLALPPLLFLLFELEFRKKALVILLCFIFDYQSAFNTPFLLKTSNIIDVTINRIGDTGYIYFVPIVAAAFLPLFWAFSKVLAIARNFKTYFVIPAFFLVTLSIIALSGYGATKNNLFGFLLIGVAGLFAKKLWLAFLLALEIQAQKRVGVTEALTGVAMHAPYFRDQLNPKSVHSGDSGAYWTGVALSLLFAVFYLFYYQLQYQLLGTEYYTVIKNGYSLALACPSTHGYDKFILDRLGNSEALLCIFSQEFLDRFVRFLLLDTMVLVIPALMMGFSFQLPYSNFLKAPNWHTFFFRLITYYSLILYRIFILEFYKFFLDVFQRRSRNVRALAVFAGVFFGGLCFHLAHDASIAAKIGAEAYLEYYLSARWILYFLALGLICAISSRLPERWRMSGPGYVGFYIVLFVLLRFVLSPAGEEIKKQFLLKALFLV